MNVPSSDDMNVCCEDTADCDQREEQGSKEAVYLSLGLVALACDWHTTLCHCRRSLFLSAGITAWGLALNSHVDEPPGAPPVPKVLTTASNPDQILYRPVVAFYCGSVDLRSVCLFWRHQKDARGLHGVLLNRWIIRLA